MILMRVLLSIKPEYADKILSGSKKYEFRKNIFRKKDIQEIVLYSSSPMKRIVGTCVIGSIIEDHPQTLWRLYREFAGICEEDFFSYFHGREKGYAIEIKEIRKFENPVDPWELDSDFTPPQSFQYISDSFCREISDILNYKRTKRLPI